MLRQNLTMIALLAATAVAQTTSTPTKTPTTKPASHATTPATAAKPATTSKSTTSAKPAMSTSTAKPASQSVAPGTKTASKSAPMKKAPAPKMAATPKIAPAKVKADIQAKVDKPAATKAAPVKTASRRDPFVSPLQLREDKMKGTAMCTTGARCLIIDQVVLKGIVKTPQGMIAMVENGSKKQYNLREKDTVFNGQVTKITGDSLIFRETVTDNLGNQSTKEVVKKVTAPVI